MKFIENEILIALKSCNDDKALGSDGFDFKFLLNFWSLLKEDVVNLFKEFHWDELFVKSLNSIFIILIPKKEGGSKFH